MAGAGRLRHCSRVLVAGHTLGRRIRHPGARPARRCQRSLGPVDRRCAQRVHPVGRIGHRRPVSVLRGGVCRLEDGGPDSRRRIPVCRRVVASRHGPGRRIWGLDPVGLWQAVDLGLAGGGRRCADGGGAAGLATRIRWLGVPLHRGGSGGRGAPAVRCPIPESGAVDAQRAMERNGLQRLLDALHAQDHDLGYRVVRPADGGLPGLDVLGLPAADFGRADTAVDRSLARRPS